MVKWFSWCYPANKWLICDLVLTSWMSPKPVFFLVQYIIINSTVSKSRLGLLNSDTASCWLYELNLTFLNSGPSCIKLSSSSSSSFSQAVMGIKWVSIKNYFTLCLAHTPHAVSVSYFSYYQTRYTLFMRLKHR